MNRNIKGLAIGLALVSLAGAQAKGATAPTQNYQAAYEDGSGYYKQVFRYPGAAPIPPMSVWRAEYGERPTSKICRPTVCILKFAAPGSATIRISTRKVGRFTIATVTGRYCVPGGLCERD